MRSLERNKREIYYALYTGNEEIKDSNNYSTGEYRRTYSQPVKARINVSAARGSAYTREFGDLQNYDKTMITTEDLPIDENTILWVDDLDITHEHDYEVVKVAKSLNENQYAIQKVKINKEPVISGVGGNG